MLVVPFSKLHIHCFHFLWRFFPRFNKCVFLYFRSFIAQNPHESHRKTYENEKEKNSQRNRVGPQITNVERNPSLNKTRSARQKTENLYFFCLLLFAVATLYRQSTDNVKWIRFNWLIVAKSPLQFIQRLFSFRRNSKTCKVWPNSMAL